MEPIEIIVIIVSILIVGGVFGRYIYKRIKHMPTGECSCCKMNGKKIVKAYYKDKLRECPNCDK